MSRYENHIETGSVRKNGLFRVCADPWLLYMFLKTNEFQIIGYIKSEERFKEVPYHLESDTSPTNC
jgi:hypothetical protein